METARGTFPSLTGLGSDIANVAVGDYHPRVDGGIQSPI